MELPKLRNVDPNAPKKKKILLLADDFRLPSGIGTISKEIIFNTVKHYDWVQLGAALQHPEAGKAFDLSQQIAAETGVADANVKLIVATILAVILFALTIVNFLVDVLTVVTLPAGTVSPTA